MTMTKQQIYDKVASHLLTQGEISMHPVDVTCCAYRGQGGLKCAIGVLIDDRHYYPEIEGKVVDCDPLIEEVLYMSGVLPAEGGYDTLTFLRELQNIHDSFPPNAWADVLRTKAEEWGLACAVLEQYQIACFTD